MRKSGSVVIDQGMNEGARVTMQQDAQGSTARPLSAEEAKKTAHPLQALADAIEQEDADRSTPPSQSRTVAAGLEYLAKLEADNAALKTLVDKATTAGKLSELEVDDLRSRLAAAESRVAELQARSDQAVAENARILGVIDCVRKAVAWPIFNGTHEPAPSLEDQTRVTVGH